MRSLITGVGGFAGQHLAARLLGHGQAVWGAARHDVDWHVPGVRRHERFTLLGADLLNPVDTRRMLEIAQPGWILHLAAQSSVQESFADPVGALHANGTTVIHLLEAARALVPRARILLVTSSEIYGRSSNGSPIDEHAELRPESPYAVSKATQDLLGYQYHVAFGLDIVRIRPFNYIGPGQSDRFVAASFARQIAEIEAGKRDPHLAAGNLEARRDFTDVRDMVAAFELALIHGEAGAAYNVGRGVAVPIRTLLDLLVARSRVAVKVHVDPARLRRADPPVSICNPARFRERTGWQPVHSLGTTLDDTLRFWRDRVSGT